MSGRPTTIYVGEPFPPPPEKVIYLAGPVPRSSSGPTWHEDAFQELRSAGFVGTIIAPVPRGTNWPDDSAGQMSWEREAMTRADFLLFWVPRDLDRMPGLTSNLEWGIWYDSGKVVLGAPPGAPKMRYLQYYASIAGAPQTSTLADAARVAVSRLRAQG